MSRHEGFRSGFERHLDADPINAVTLADYVHPVPPRQPTRGNELAEPRLPVAPEVGEWIEQAACHSAATDLWYDPQTYPEARAVCRRCPVQDDCLEHAMSVPERYGMWGGLSPRRREKLAAERRRDAA